MIINKTLKEDLGYNNLTELRMNMGITCLQVAMGIYENGIKGHFDGNKITYHIPEQFRPAIESILEDINMVADKEARELGGRTSREPFTRITHLGLLGKIVRNENVSKENFPEIF